MNDLHAGIVAAQAGDKLMALSLLRRASDENPNSELAWLWRAKVAPDMQEFEVCLRRALQINPRNKRTRVWLEEIADYGEVSRPQAAWQCPICEQAFTVKPFRCSHCRSILTLTDLDAFFVEGLQVERDRLFAAIDRLNSASDDSGSGDLVFRFRTLALAHLNLGQPKLALEHLQRAVEIQPNDLDMRVAAEKLERRFQKVRDLLRLEAEDQARVPNDPHVHHDAQSRHDFQPRDDAQTRHDSRVDLGTRPLEVLDPRILLGEQTVVSLRATIMVVDDSPTIRQVLAKTLEEKGFDVIQAASGMETLAKIQGAMPDLVILDVSMPHLDGYRVCKIIKDNELTQHIPVVFLTGKTGFLDRVKGRVAGGVEYLAKPVKKEMLFEIIGRHLNRHVSGHLNQPDETGGSQSTGLEESMKEEGRHGNDPGGRR